MSDPKGRLFKRLIREYEFLLEDFEDVYEIHKQANIEMSSELNKVKPKDVFEADYLESEEEPEKENEPGHNDKDLKKLFRKIVFICHPDKAKAEDNAARRTELARYYEQAVTANDEGNWALMVVVAIKLGIELPEEAEAQVEKIQTDTDQLREKINAMTQSYVWQWYQAEEEKRKEMVETYLGLLTKSLNVKKEEPKKSKLILGLGHPRTGTGYTAKLLQSWGLDVGHEKMGEHGTVDWSLSAGDRSLWQDADFKDCEWQHIIYCVRDPRETIASLIYTENTKEGSMAFREKYGVRGHSNPIIVAINSIYRWDELISSLNPKLVFRIEDQSELLFNYLKDQGIELNWNDLIIGQKQNTREHPNWEEVVETFGNLSAKYKIKINMYCRKYGYPCL